jgi:PRTRC genetic system protein C
MTRLFVYDNREFPDPDPNLSVDEVRKHFAEFFPELTNADTREERRGEQTLYTFCKRIGTKGGGPSDRPRACVIEHAYEPVDLRTLTHCHRYRYVLDSRIGYAVTHAHPHDGVHQHADLDARAAAFGRSEAEAA